MSRLIDVDKLIERMKEDTSEAKKSLSQDNYVDKEVWERVIQIIESYIDIIDNLPSAYDVEKVIEQLECEEGTVCGHKFINKNCFGCEGCNDCKMEDAYRYAIEVVKAGGIDE